MEGIVRGERVRPHSCCAAAARQLQATACAKSRWDMGKVQEWSSQEDRVIGGITLSPVL